MGITFYDVLRAIAIRIFVFGASVLAMAGYYRTFGGF